jgi:hypothetical protein
MQIIYSRPDSSEKLLKENLIEQFMSRDELIDPFNWKKEQFCKQFRAVANTD